VRAFFDRLFLLNEAQRPSKWRLAEEPASQNDFHLTGEMPSSWEMNGRQVSDSQMAPRMSAMLARADRQVPEPKAARREPTRGSRSDQPPRIPASGKTCQKNRPKRQLQLYYRSTCAVTFLLSISTKSQPGVLVSNKDWVNLFYLLRSKTLDLTDSLSPPFSIFMLLSAKALG
jgi:hypothetical protein